MFVNTDVLIKMLGVIYNLVQEKDSYSEENLFLLKFKHKIIFYHE